MTDISTRNLPKSSLSHARLRGKPRPSAESKKPIRSWWQCAPPGKVLGHRLGDLLCSDAIEGLSALSDGIADIVFLDPPFNLGKSYGESGARADRLQETDYATFMHQVLTHSIRILREGGALYLYHLPRWAIKLAPALEASLSFRHWIAVSMKNGFARGRGLYPAHYALLYFTKGNPAVFSRPKIQPLTCPHCDEYIKDYGGYRKHIEAGVNLSDIWDDISPVRHKKYKIRESNELPLVIPRRIIEISGRRGGLLVDPFAGAGSAVIAARLKQMRFVAIDREIDNCNLIVKRLANTSTLREKK